MELNKTKETEQMINDTLNNRINELNNLNEQIAETEMAISDAVRSMEIATKEGNLKAYQKAKAMKRDLEDAKEMYETRINSLNNKPLISKEDYEKTVMEIYLEVGNIEVNTKQNLSKLSEDMFKESKELENAQEYANKVLKKLQNELYRNNDRSKSKDGTVIYFKHENKEVDCWSVINWGKRSIQDDEYKKFKGNKIR